MTEEEKQFNQWFDQYANGVKVFEEADMKQAYLQGRAELEQENAELKEKLGNYQKGMFDEIEKRDINLTKAKDLLAKWVELFKPKLEGYPITPIQEQTEQFLKDSEVEK